MTDIIPVFYSCDDIFAPYMIVSLTSLLKNCSKQRRYIIHILSTGLSDDIQKAALSLKSDYVDIRFENVSRYIGAIENKLPIRDYYTKTTYYRFFIAEMFPDYDKALYIDSDTVVLGDISELFDTDLTDYYVAAAHEQAMLQVEAYGNYVEKVCGIDRNAYFNAGILLINARLFREKAILKKFAQLLKTYNFRVTQDEDYLNILCKDRVRFLSSAWNMEVLGKLPCSPEETKIIHFIMTSKPWHYRDCRLKEYFWLYAEETPFYERILNELESYTPENRQRDLISCEKLELLAIDEADRSDGYWAKELEKRSPDRVAVLKKIENLETNGVYDVDVEADPPTKPITGEVDYAKRKKLNKIKAKFAFFVARRFVNGLVKKNKFIYKGVTGKENLSDLKTGAVITCNHFNAFDSFAIHMAYEEAGLEDRNFFRVIREGNYTNFPGLYGFFMRNCNTLPISSSYSEFKKFDAGVELLLSEGKYVLVYPEQSMWWNYRKPRPLKNGAFHFAAKNSVPIVPCFITLKDSEIIGEDGFPVQEYTVHISPPVYPDKNKPLNQRVNALREENKRVWEEIYEQVYGIPLKMRPIHKKMF